MLRKGEWSLLSGLFLWLLVAISACGGGVKFSQTESQPLEVIKTTAGKGGPEIQIEFYKGPAHNHPTIAVWIEDLEQNYLQTLYVTRYIGTGIFGHGALGPGRWSPEPGRAVRPAALPYWLHKRSPDDSLRLPSPENPVTDAITSATPRGDFLLASQTPDSIPAKFRLLLEVNQTWDWNDYWTNNKFPDDQEYKTSCQPSVIYAVTIDTNDGMSTYYMNPIGHGHYSGQDGRLYTDLSTLTTALDIADQIVVKLVQ